MADLPHFKNNFPNLENSVDPGRVKDGHPSWVPATASETGSGRFHPHDGRGLEVLRPDLASVVAHREEVLRVERVPLHGHHLAAMALNNGN